MPELDGKHYSYDEKGQAQYKKDKKKKSNRKKNVKVRNHSRSKPSLRDSIMGGGY